VKLKVGSSVLKRIMSVGDRNHRSKLSKQAVVQKTNAAYFEEEALNGFKKFSVPGIGEKR
jgi:hypothetical protein